jgi:hypothetical protein
MYDGAARRGGGIMGGIRSGARRSANVGNVEDTLALDIRLLRRLGVVAPGECIIDTVRWNIGGLNAPNARLRIDLSDIERGGVMAITGRMPGGAIMQDIAIEIVSAPFGGHRCYFICPTTGCRCEVVYFAHGRFASRKAQRLTYAVQGMTELSAAVSKATKLRRRLRGTTALPRPRGRNRIALAQRVRDAEIAAKALYHSRLCRTANASATRRRPREGS